MGPHTVGYNAPPPQSLPPQQATPPPREGDEFLVTELRLAMRYKEAGACLRLVEQAGQERRLAAVPLLRELLQPNYWQKRKLRGEAWMKAREAAAFALAHIGTPEAISALMSALHDPQWRIREASASALGALGSLPSPFLLPALEFGVDWSFDGMKRLIGLLGGIGERRAVIALLRVLSGDLPLSPTRWTSMTFFPPLYSVLGIFIFVWGAVSLFTGMVNFPSFSLIDLIPNLMRAGGQSLTILFWMTLLGILPGVALYFLLLIFLFFPMRVATSKKERNELAGAAAQSLGRLRDKHALPGLITAAVEGHFSKRTEAHYALCELLPLVEPEDAKLLQGEPLRHLTHLLDHSDPPLTVALVRAMEFVGTGQAAAPMERLVERISTSTPAWIEAKRVLPLLQERLRQEQNQATLLRASAMPDTPSEQLLRPAQGHLETPQEQLLRPSE